MFTSVNPNTPACAQPSSSSPAQPSSQPTEGFWGKVTTSVSESDLYRRFFSTQVEKPSADKASEVGPRTLLPGNSSLSKASVIRSAEEFNATLKGSTFPKLGDGKTTALDQVRALYDEATILQALQNTQVLVHPTVSQLMDGFLQYKLKFGSKVEKQFYASMPKEAFIQRLIIKRPFVFMGESDYYKLKDGKQGDGGFETIGTNYESHLRLQDYLSYDEMEIAAMIGVSVPTRFINKGHRSNQGFVDSTGNYEKEGICLGLVGARLEREGYMEYQRVMVTPTQNTKANGYGPLPKEEEDNAITAKMRLYARFYQIDHFPTYEEVAKSPDWNVHFAKCHEGFISKNLYKRRIKVNIENYLQDANARAGACGKKAYAQPYGWGLSAWIKDDIQRQWFIEAFLEVMQSRSYPHIADVDFSFVMKYGGLQKFLSRDGQMINNMKVHFPTPDHCRELCEKLTGVDAGKLLVNSYGWDGNSYCGNEYWDAALTASGDPIMMCASPLQVFAQVPEINPYLMQNILEWK